MEASANKNNPEPANAEIDLSRLNIPVWQDALSLPLKTQPNQNKFSNLEHQLKFALIRSESGCSVFISNRTQFIRLMGYLPFIEEPYELYQCNSVLIDEYLQYSKSGPSFSGRNEATQQLTELLESATTQNASDIHIEQLASGGQIRMRVDGVLKKYVLKSKFGTNLISKIKLISDMDIAISRTPQDGHFEYMNRLGRKYDLRTSSIPGVFGEKIVIRLLPATPVRFAMEQLGFSIDFLKTARSVLDKKAGMILFTGPTGSGKTTSLYAILNELASDTLNITTIEDPVEYRIDSITQVAVNQQSGLTFSAALRSFLRQDPDVILVGEIRDHETAAIACRAAQTGHLVLTTIHCNDVFEVFQRLKGLDISADDIASSLSLIVSQRLLSKKCHCQNHDPSCSYCSGSGTLGRIPVLEYLEIDSDLKKIIQTEFKPETLRSYAFENGFLSLKERVKSLIQEGIIEPSHLVLFD